MLNDKNIERGAFLLALLCVLGAVAIVALGVVALTGLVNCLGKL